MNTVYLPAAPLLEALRRRGVSFSGAGETVGKALHRAQSSGLVSARYADELACRLLGQHPVEVWGPAWWEVDQR
jgi:hypothetical protein